MKRILLVSTFICIILTLGLATAAAKANFSGTWIMDKARSEGLPPDMEQTMTVTQTDDTLNLETRVATDMGDQTVPAAYTLNGKDIEYTPKRGGAEGRGKRTAKWNADGNGLEVVEEEKFDSANGEVAFQATRKWQLQPDGTLVIEMDVKGPNGPQHSKRTFVKK